MTPSDPEFQGSGRRQMASRRSKHGTGQYCRAKHSDQAIDLGDAAAETLGGMSLTRLAELMKGEAQPLNENERAVLHQLAKLSGSKDGWKAA